MYKRNTFSYLILLSLGSFFLAPTTHAQEINKGIVLSPIMHETVLDSNHSETLAQFTLSNKTKQTLDFTTKSVDFGALDESGGVAFLGLEKNSLHESVDPAEWITVDPPVFSIPPSESIKITAHLKNLPSITPGGHYAAIVFSLAENINLDASVSIERDVSALLFITKKGGEIFGLTLDKVEPNKRFYLNYPPKIKLRFFNTGNTHLKPYGLVTVKNRSGKTFAKGIINESSALILPNTYKQTTVTLKSVAPLWWPGRYELAVEYHHNQEEALNLPLYKTDIIIIPVWYYVIGLLAIVGAMMRVRRRRASAHK